MDSKAIIVVGSLHYDIMIDAPYQPRTGETVTGSQWRPKFGGKGGNQAVAVQNAGGNCRMVSAVGSDEFGSFLLAQLRTSGVSTDHIQMVNNTGTGMSVAITDTTGDYAAVIVSGANLELDIQSLNHDTLWQGASMLLLQNEIAEQVNIAAARQAKLSRIPVCYNAAPARPIPDELCQSIDILIVNEIEAEMLSGYSVESLASANEVAVLLAQEYPTVIVTAGSKGVAAATDQGENFSLKAVDVQVVSTHGAGDTFVGCLCAALVSGQSLQEAVTKANTAASMHVSARQKGLS